MREARLRCEYTWTIKVVAYGLLMSALLMSSSILRCGVWSRGLVRRYRRFYIGTRVGNKYLCVVVKVMHTDAFVVTAYLTDKVKKGRQLWPREK